MRIKDDTIKKISSTTEKLLSGAYVATSMGMTQFSKLKFNFSPRACLWLSRLSNIVHERLRDSYLEIYRKENHNKFTSADLLPFPRCL